MEIKGFESSNRRLMIEFSCRRCRRVELEPLESAVARMDDYSPFRLDDIPYPAGWKDGGFFYNILCPDCAAAYERFMNMEGV